MHLRLKTKITLIISGLVLAVVLVNSWLYMATLTRQVIRESDNRARQVAQEVFFQAQNALADSAANGNAPLSNSPEDMRNYVRGSLDQNAALSSLIDAEVSYSFLVYEVTIVDHNGVALISSDASLPDHSVLPRTPLDQLANSSFIDQWRVLFGPPRAYEVSYPFNLGPAGHQAAGRDPERGRVRGPGARPSWRLPHGLCVAGRAGRRRRSRGTDFRHQERE